MRIDRTMMALAAAALAALPGAAVHAQASGSAQLSGPEVPGVCYLSRDQIFAESKVGQAFTARMKQLTDQAQGEIEAQRQPIETDVQAYRAKSSSLSADQRQSQEQALAQRMQAVQVSQQTKARQLQLTQAKASQQIGAYAQPIITSAYSSRKCGVLFDRNLVLGGNMTNDLTAAVIQGLDAKVTTISFNLEPAPAATQGAGTP
jgi:Skp family chaperone for outer membrane proteins